MGNSLRCCLACVIPCGALDMIRIVHLNGHVEELSGPISAGEVLKANPNHVLSKPCSQGVVRRILILSPGSDLKRGQIYFLIPASSLPEKKNKKIQRKKDPSKKKNKPEQALHGDHYLSLHGDHYLSETLYEKKSSRRDRRAGGVGVWRPHLESISEDSSRLPVPEFDTSGQICDPTYTSFSCTTL